MSLGIRTQCFQLCAFGWEKASKIELGSTLCFFVTFVTASCSAVLKKQNNTTQKSPNPKQESTFQSKLPVFYGFKGK